MRKAGILNKIGASVRARQSGTGGPEFEQGLLRVVFAAVVAAYLALYAMGIPPETTGAGVLLFVWAYLAVALATVLAVWVWPAPSVLRRVLGIVIDVGTATWALWALGEAGVVIVGVFLFIILGSGFRYGRNYMHITQALSIVGFTSVMFGAPWWSTHAVVGVGMGVILIIIPFYVGALAQRINVARLKAEQALEECRRNHGGETSGG